MQLFSCVGKSDTSCQNATVGSSPAPSVDVLQPDTNDLLPYGDPLELKPDLLTKQEELLQQFYLEHQRRCGAGSDDGTNSLQAEDKERGPDEEDGVSCLIVPSLEGRRRDSHPGTVPLWAWYSPKAVPPVHGVAPSTATSAYCKYCTCVTSVRKEDKSPRPSYVSPPSACAICGRCDRPAPAASFIAPMLAPSRPPSVAKDVSFQEAIRQRLFQSPATIVTTIVPLGPQSTHMICPHCHHEIDTAIKTTPSKMAWIASLVICLIGCNLGCCLIPFCMDDCMSTDHNCPNCKAYLGQHAKN